MRSANRNVTNSNNVGYMNTSGNVSNNNANNGNYAAPDYTGNAGKSLVHRTGGSTR